MNGFRVFMNLAISAACGIGGVYLLFRGSILVRDRNDAAVAWLFSGASLYSLVLALFCLAAFCYAVARAWLKGDVSMPGPDEIRPRPDYKGQLLLKYWYFAGPAIGFVVAAFFLASQVPAR